MTAPSDGWDSDEREVLESADLSRQLDDVRAKHTLGHEDQARLLARVQREAGTKIPPARASREWPRWGIALVAASVLLIAGTLWTLHRSGGAPSGAGTPESTVAVVPPQPARVFYLPLEKPDIKISPASLSYRGPAGENPLLADLKPAFDAFRAGDYPAADREFSGLSDKYPKAVEIAFYQGVARLFSGNPQQAIVSLTAAERVTDSSFAFDVAWYRAVAEERAGNLAGARARLTEMCVRRVQRACSELKRFPQ